MPLDLDTMTATLLRIRELAPDDEAYDLAVERLAHYAEGDMETADVEESSSSVSTSDMAGVTGQRLTEDDGEPADLDAAEALANLHAEVLNAIEAGGDDTETYAATADDELDGSGWNLARSRQGGWHAVRDTAEVQESRSFTLTELLEAGGERSPAGGVTLNGKHYPGGQFIPGKAIAAASPEDKAKLEKAKADSDARASAKSAERKAKPVDRASLADRLSKATGGRKLLPSQEKSARASYRMLQRFHGDEALHRVQEIADAAEAALAKLDRSHPAAVRLRQRLGELAWMAGQTEKSKEVDSDAGRKDAGDSGEHGGSEVAGDVRRDDVVATGIDSRDGVGGGRKGVSSTADSTVVDKPGAGGVAGGPATVSVPEKTFAEEAFRRGVKTGNPNLRILTAKQVENLVAQINGKLGRSHFTVAGVNRGDLSTGYTGLPVSVTRLPDGRYAAQRNLDAPVNEPTQSAVQSPREVSHGDAVEWAMEMGGRELKRSGVVRSVADGMARVFTGSGVDRVPVEQLRTTGKRGVPFGSRGLDLLRSVADDPATKGTPIGKVAWNLVDEIDRNNTKMDISTEKFIREGDPAEVYAMLQDVASKGMAHAGGEVRRAATDWVAKRPPEPGFTGTDSQNRQWVNGELVAKQEAPAEKANVDDGVATVAGDVANQGGGGGAGGKEAADAPAGVRGIDPTEKAQAEETPYDRVKGLLAVDNHKDALELIRKLPMAQIDDLWRKVTGSGFYNQTKKQMLARIEQEIPHMTDSRQKELRHDQEQGLQRSEVKRLLTGMKAHAEGNLGAPIDMTLSDEAFRNPHDPAHKETVQASYRRMIHDAASKLDQSHEANAAILDSLKKGGLFGDPEQSKQSLSTDIPDHIRSSLQRAMHPLERQREGLQQGVKADAQFRGNGRYEWDAFVNGKVADAKEPETVRKFRELAKENGVDADAVLKGMGYALPELSEKGRAYGRDDIARRDRSGSPVSDGERKATGFTGTDAQGRQWVNGELVARRDEPATQDAGKPSIPDEPPAPTATSPADTPGTVEHFKSTVLDPMQRGQGGKPLYKEQVERLAARYNARHGTSLDIYKKTPEVPSAEEVAKVHQATGGKAMTGEKLHNILDKERGAGYASGGVGKPPEGEGKMEPVATKKVNTRFGVRHLHTFKPDDAFWKAYRAGKIDKMVRVGKTDAGWEVSVWGDSPEDVTAQVEKIRATTSESPPKPVATPAATSASAPVASPVASQSTPDKSSRGFDWDEYHRQQDWKDDNDDYEPAPAPRPSEAEVDEAATVRALRSAEDKGTRQYGQESLKNVAAKLKPVAVFHRFAPSVGRSESFMVGADGKAYQVYEGQNYDGTTASIVPLDIDAEMISKLKVLAEKQAKEHPEWAQYHASFPSTPPATPPAAGGEKPQAGEGKMTRNFTIDGDRVTFDRGDGYKVSMRPSGRGHSITITSGGKSQDYFIRPDSVQDAVSPDTAAALKKIGKNPADYFSVGGYPVDRKAKPAVDHYLSKIGGGDPRRAKLSDLRGKRAAALDAMSSARERMAFGQATTHQREVERLDAEIASHLDANPDIKAEEEAAEEAKRQSDIRSAMNQ